MVSNNPCAFLKMDMWWRGLPYTINNEYMLVEGFGHDTVCPFVEKTGRVDYSQFSLTESIVTVEHEKDNPADKKALKVLIDGVFVGYLYRSSYARKNIWEYMDNSGKYYVYGKLCTINYVEERVRVIIGVYKKIDLSEYVSIGTPKFRTNQNREKVELAEYLHHFVCMTWDKYDNNNYGCFTKILDRIIHHTWFPRKIFNYLDDFVYVRKNEYVYRCYIRILSRIIYLGYFPKKVSDMLDDTVHLSNCLLYVKDVKVNRRGTLDIIIEVFAKKADIDGRTIKSLSPALRRVK